VDIGDVGIATRPTSQGADLSRAMTTTPGAASSEGADAALAAEEL
jgi:hypothetical protein